MSAEIATRSNYGMHWTALPPIKTIVAAALSVSAVGCAEPPQRVNPVGLSFAAYEDTARRSWTKPQNRPLATAVWYPAALGSRESEWRVGIFSAGWSAQKAPLSAAVKRPLIVLSHGTGGGAAGLSWLAETLASNGYIVAAVNHHGNTAAEPSYELQGFMLWWERARDISVLIDKLLGDPQFGAHIDPSRIGVAGFSLGGYTALATVGARLEYQQWKTFCATQPLEPNCTLPPEASFSMANVQQLLDHDDRVKEAVSHSHESFRDARIRAAFTIAPVLGPVMTKASLAEVGVPVRIIVGSKDDQAFPDVNARPIASAIPNADLVGKVVARSLCTDPDKIDRDEVHRRVSADALKFFNRALQGQRGGNETRK